MKPAVMYHWWSEWSDAPPIKNLRTPVLLSIATLRAHEPEVPIYVIDGSIHTHNRDYGDYPSKLGFKVVPVDMALVDYDNRPGWRHLSRLFDVHKLALTIPEETILYCDTDVFWKASPFPLEKNPDKFCFNQYNSGYFYYNKNSKPIQRMMEIFWAYTITALNDENFRVISRQCAGYNDWYYVFDEAILGYMHYKHPELFEIIGLREHCTPSSTFAHGDTALAPQEVRMVHCNGVRVVNDVAKHITEAEYSRGLVPLLFEEFYTAICKSIDPLEAYTQAEIDRFLPLQVKFVDPMFWQFFSQNRGSDRLYNLIPTLETYHRHRASQGGVLA